MFGLCVFETNLAIRSQMKTERGIQMRGGGGAEEEEEEEEEEEDPCVLTKQPRNAVVKKELGSLAQDGPCDWV